MSRSLKRVKAALAAAGVEAGILEVDDRARTAQGAAEVVGCSLDQIAKSILFRGEESGEVVLFVTAGGNQVSAGKAGQLAGEPLGKADAALIRARTGFAIGGVSPVGHLAPPRTFWDPRLSDFAEVWAAAGTPRHLFGIAPALLQRISGATPAEFTL
ncbi:YbaK/EbsC family protein [Poseidonocella sp. HB161398]|uniref:YbaK/EbsC family protein n=1 Tax=Poseidonocella sp. HB161398 TaxID=2320855 RepID=UPI001108EB06|nr:YbaK/EbsC family protein [Poseidonocella sp. HB161398]